MKRISITTATMFLGLAAFAIGASQEWVISLLSGMTGEVTHTNGVTTIYCNGAGSYSSYVVEDSTVYGLVVTNATSAAAPMTNGTRLVWREATHDYYSTNGVIVAETNAFYYGGTASVFTNDLVTFPSFAVLRTMFQPSIAAKILGGL